MQTVYSVSEINRYIKLAFSKDKVLSNVWIKGELSNFKNHSSGHLYFSLKDNTSIIKCVMFKAAAGSLRFAPENGMKVLIRGSISVFDRDGIYQLYVEEMQPEGYGALYLAFEQLKKKLSFEGLFDEANKKVIPTLPKSVGIITSPTGAVIRDIINVASRRFPEMALKIFPVQVQGDVAAKQIASALNTFNKLKNVDVIIVARGGGSIEDLWAFNEEVLARAVYESTIPVISAVGHETDFTICDFVADLRAPTPSAAAELAVPDKEILIYKIASMRMRLKSELLGILDKSTAKLDKLMSSPELAKPYYMIEREREKLIWLNEKMEKSFKNVYNSNASKFIHLAGKLDALSPLKVLERGYVAISPTAGEKMLTSVEQIKVNDVVDIRFKDGIASAKVIEIK